MKHHNTIVSVFAAFALAMPSFAAIRAVTPTPWDNGKTNSWQMSRHADKMKQVSEGGAKIVFIGDSITHFWETKGKA